MKKYDQVAGDAEVKTALFINGVFESVLQEVLTAQAAQNGGINYLQPHKGAYIKPKLPQAGFRSRLFP